MTTEGQNDTAVKDSLWRPSVAPGEDPELGAQERVGEGKLDVAKARQLGCEGETGALALQRRSGG